MTYDFRLQTNTEPELEKVTALFKRVWPTNPRFNLDYVTWLYRDNPHGQAIGYNAFAGDQVAAHYVVIPFPCEIEGRPATAALALNTAVDDRHRGQALFRKLAEIAHQRARDAGVDHIVAVANANSTPTFLRHLGFQLVGPLDVKFCLRPPQPRDARIDWQWQRRWSPEGLAWRLRNPSGRYWLATSSGHSCILGATKYPGVHAVLKVETERSMRRQADEILAARATLRPVLWFGKNANLRFGAAVDVPMWLRPSPFNIIYFGLASQTTKLVSERVHFEAADFDVM